MSISVESRCIWPRIFSKVPVNFNSGKVANKIFISICVFSWIASVFTIPSFKAFSILLCLLTNSSVFFLLQTHWVQIWTVADSEARTFVCFFIIYNFYESSLSTRATSLWASRFLTFWRLSCIFFPRPIASSSLIKPSFRYILRGINVRPCSFNCP